MLEILIFVLIYLGVLWFILDLFFKGTYKIKIN